MKNYKIVFLIFSFIFSIAASQSVFAQTTNCEGIPQAQCVANTCAQNTGYNPAPGAQNPPTVVTAYNSCVTQGNTPPSPQTNPTLPPPLAPDVCNGLTPAQCQSVHEAHQQQVNAYNEWLASQQNPPSTTGQGGSATETFEDITAKLNKSAQKMRGLSQMLTSTGISLVVAGTTLWIMGATSVPPKPPMIKAGKIMVASGAGMIVFGLVTGRKATDLANKAAMTCEQYNKIATKQLVCPNAQEVGTGDGTLVISSSTGNGVPSFIDPVTGLCRPGAPIECTTLTKDLPPGCWKKGGACMAGGKVPPITTKDGKVTMDLNGKKRTFGIEDFASEEAMVKAGFTPDQAKQFFSDMNNPNGILAQNGLNAKGELKSVVKGEALSGGSGSSYSSGGYGSTGTGNGEATLQKDEYNPFADREPASAEGLVKDYHGDTIGVDRDDIFKMINRRYILKTHQKIFIDQ